ncbi:MAG: hypothetical protein AAF488_03255 [Planctomycetota bacterium]
MHVTFHRAVFGLALCLIPAAVIAQQATEIPMPPPPWVDPPEVDESVCGDAPAGYHYELDATCMNSLKAEFQFQSVMINGERNDARATADQLRDADVAHADEQLRGCVEMAAGDPEGIAACESWHAVEIATANSQHQAAIAAAHAAYDAAIQALKDKFLEDVKDCCNLVADPPTPDPPTPDPPIPGDHFARETAKPRNAETTPASPPLAATEWDRPSPHPSSGGPLSSSLRSAALSPLPPRSSENRRSLVPFGTAEWLLRPPLERNVSTRKDG